MAYYGLTHGQKWCELVTMVGMCMVSKKFMSVCLPHKCKPKTMGS